MSRPAVGAAHVTISPTSVLLTQVSDAALSNDEDSRMALLVAPYQTVPDSSVMSPFSVFKSGSGCR